ncbi:MAG: radical SAM protein [Candidatus Endolissoclinum sp. TMED37]|nr:MAG: radical SAM protein [Candidatus Endolissoclinum sp. TMED37]|tara:strand:- start:3270 stop:4241 length:972 start_codon:yes stop_codon:yes gene_type:complete
MNKFGFYEHLTKDFPSQVMIDVTEYCDLACIHCPHPTFVKSEHFKGTFLEVDLHNKAIDEIKKDGLKSCRYVRYTSNGEPLIHKNLSKMIEYTSNIIPEVSTNLTTNAKLLDSKKAIEILKTGIDVIDISIDAFNEDTYSKIRVKGDLNVTRPNVLNLINQKNKMNTPTKIIVSYVEQELNKNETDQFEEFWKKNGADFVAVRRIHSCAGSKEEKRIEMIENQKVKKSFRKPCLYPWERLIIAPNGFLSFCPADWKYGSKFVDFRDTTIKVAWNSHFMESLRNAHLSNNFSCHSFCGQCPDWEATKWPNEGRSYANIMHEMSS